MSQGLLAPLLAARLGSREGDVGRLMPRKRAAQGIISTPASMISDPIHELLNTPRGVGYAGRAKPSRFAHEYFERLASMHAGGDLDGDDVREVPAVPEAPGGESAGTVTAGANQVRSLCVGGVTRTLLSSV